jgi:hypothetical protein
MESVSVLNGPQPGASGTITVSGPGTQLTVGAGQQRQAFFNYGATVTITSTAASGSAFTGWSGDCSGYGSCVIVATRSLYIQGSFAVGEKLQVRLTGKGAGTVMSTPAGISCPGTCAGLFGVDSEVTLRATPAPGSYFAAGLCRPVATTRRAPARSRWRTPTTWTLPTSASTIASSRA